jgi:hypothetical protein
LDVQRHMHSASDGEILSQHLHFCLPPRA